MNGPFVSNPKQFGQVQNKVCVLNLFAFKDFLDFWTQYQQLNLQKTYNIRLTYIKSMYWKFAEQKKAQCTAVNISYNERSLRESLGCGAIWVERLKMMSRITQSFILSFMYLMVSWYLEVIDKLIDNIVSFLNHKKKRENAWRQNQCCSQNPPFLFWRIFARNFIFFELV